MRLPLPGKKEPASAPSKSPGWILCRHRNFAPVTVRVLSFMDGFEISEDETSSSESDDDEEEDLLQAFHVLDLNLQRKLEQRMKMKVGKHVRIRRKKLERHRRMRKSVYSKRN